MLYWQVILIYQISTGLLVPFNPQYGYKVNRALLDTVEDHGLIQQVHKPTRLTFHHQPRPSRHGRGIPWHERSQYSYSCDQC